MMIEAAIAEFSRHHGGRSPEAVLVSRRAAVILAAQDGLPAVYDGVPCEITDDEVDLAIPGQGNCVALIAAPLRGSLVGVVAGEAVRSTTI